MRVNVYLTEYNTTYMCLYYKITSQLVGLTVCVLTLVSCSVQMQHTDDGAEVGTGVLIIILLERLFPLV